MDREVLQQRHKQVEEAIADTPLVMTAYDSLQKSADMAHPFTQEATFLWLTGITEPGWQAVLERGKLILIAPEHDEMHLLFDGGLTNEAALHLSGADSVVGQREGEALLKELALKYQSVYTLGEDPHAEHYSFTENGAPARLRTRLRSDFKEIKDARSILSKLRAIKTQEELACMREAIAISVSGFEAVRETLATSEYEYEVEALLNSAFRKTGATGHAYDPIIAGGVHACTLHYATNNDALPKDGLLLIDAGATVKGYAADITRTFALGSPTPRQQAVHAAVEKAHWRIIELIKPGLALKSYAESVDDIMKDALQEVELLKDRTDTETYRKYFPHAISHGLGIDVHESLGGYKEFVPGMVLTVEPGIYIPEEGIGVRIEDDILVTEEGCENLSAALPTHL